MLSPQMPRSRRLSSSIFHPLCVFVTKSRSILFTLLSASYRASLVYYTSDPIEKIRHASENAHDQQSLREALVDFRHRKEEELAFVRRAVSQIPFNTLENPISTL